jgi:hypothetical protein
VGVAGRHARTFGRQGCATHSTFAIRRAVVSGSQQGVPQCDYAHQPEAHDCVLLRMVSLLVVQLIPSCSLLVECGGLLDCDDCLWVESREIVSRE